jgi:hypothetical protein
VVQYYPGRVLIADAGRTYIRKMNWPTVVLPGDEREDTSCVLQIKLPALVHALTSSSTQQSSGTPAAAAAAAGAAAGAGAAPAVSSAAAGVGDVVEGPLGIPMKLVAVVPVELKVYRYQLSYRLDVKVMLVGLMHVLDGFIGFRLVAQEKVGEGGGGAEGHPAGRGNTLQKCKL